MDARGNRICAQVMNDLDSRHVLQAGKPSRKAMAEPGCRSDLLIQLRFPQCSMSEVPIDSILQACFSGTVWACI